MPEAATCEERAAEQFHAALPCSVLVMSCYAYRDLWIPFFTLVQRHWPDCPFPVYLGVDHVRDAYSIPAKVLEAGELPWSGRLRKHLEAIPTPYVLLLLDDFFIDAPVISNELIALLRRFLDVGGLAMRLRPLPGPDAGVDSSDDFGIVAPSAPYRMSTQAAFWDSSALICLLDPNESIWEFEWSGTERLRSREDLTVYCTYASALPYRHVVERGEWFWGAAAHFRHREIGCDFTRRAVMSPFTAARKGLHRAVKNSIRSVLPVSLRPRR